LQFLLDKAFGVISYAGMRSKGKSRDVSYRAWELQRSVPAAVLAAALCLVASGCMGSLRNHAGAVSAATAPVVDQAAAAYREANEIHERRMDYDAVAEFEKDHSVAKLRVIHPLMTHYDVAVRLTVLKGFQAYVQTVAEITSDKEPKELNDATASLGANLAGVGNAMAALHPGAAITTTPDVAISSTTQNIIATGANAIARFLIYRAAKKDLPKQIIGLDPQVQEMCRVMEEEVGIMLDAETKDFDHILDEQKLFLMDPSITMSEVERRDEIAKMQALVREQHEAETHLAGLRAALVRLAKAHAALTEDAKGNTPEPLKAKLGELINAGQSLADFYSSLSAPAS
jgi:hypothetical protein